MKCDQPYVTTDGRIGCPHCGQRIDRECVPNTIECSTCEDAMIWNRNGYVCHTCGSLDETTVPTECGECGRQWPWPTNESEVGDGYH